jgi:hypothetical protein
MSLAHAVVCFGLDVSLRLAVNCSFFGGTFMKHYLYLSFLLLAVLQISSSSVVQAQTGFFSKWESRVRETSAGQPGWIVPVITPSSGLVQLVRTDIVRQYTPTRTLTMNYDNSKGVNLIPYYKTELDVDLPSYIQHNTRKVKDGAGDFSAVLKYRLFAGNETHGNYSVSVQLLATGATGSYKNGTASTTYTPAVVGGKGFGHFDIQSSIGGLLPTHSVNAIGRTIAWNTVAQYKIGKMFWPEVESNASYYFLGPHAGMKQNFLTPGLMVGRIKLRKDPKDRLAFFFGGGMQIATSHYHAYNHELVFTSRISF